MERSRENEDEPRNDAPRDTHERDDELVPGETFDADDPARVEQQRADDDGVDLPVGEVFRGGS